MATLTPITDITGPLGPKGNVGDKGDQGLPGPGAAAWAALQAVTTGSVRQAPDGSWIKSTATRTTGLTFDAAEQAFWTPVSAYVGTMEQVALTKTYVSTAGKTTAGKAAPLKYFNLKDYGAIGDNVADDTAAVQAAVNAAANEMLFVPNGQYKLTAPINLPNTLIIQGNSPKGASTARFTTTHAGYAFIAPAASNFRLDFRNIFVTCVNGFDMRSTTLAQIGLATFDQVAFSGGDGTGIAINCLNHDFSKITNCGFFWNGLCAIRLCGWYGIGGKKAITAMEVSNNYFGSPLKIGISVDIFESIYCEQNDFGSVTYPVDIGGERLSTFGPAGSLHYYKRGETKPVEGYFGYGTNFYFRDNHIEGATTAVSAWGKNADLKSLHVHTNNVFTTVSAAVFARCDRVNMSTFADNIIDFFNNTISECFAYTNCIHLILRDNHHYTRISGGTANPNTYKDYGGNYFVDTTRRGATGTAYDAPF